MTPKTAAANPSRSKKPATKKGATAKKAARSARPEPTAAEINRDRQHMLQLLERARASAIAEGLPLLDLDGIEEEVASRRGGVY